MDSLYSYRTRFSDEDDSFTDSSSEIEVTSSLFSRMRIVDSSTTSDPQKILYSWMNEIEYGPTEEGPLIYSKFPPKTISISSQLPSEEKKIVEMSVRSIAFSQSSVSRTFTDGRSLEEATNQLISGKISPKDFPPIRVVKHNNQWITLDNRRLRVFLNASFIDKVPVIKCSLADTHVSQEFWAKKSNKSLNQGGSIRVDSATSSRQHFVEGIFVFNRMVLNWNVNQIQMPLPNHPSTELPDYFISREAYYKSFEAFIFEEARAVLQNGIEPATLAQTPLLTLSLLKKFNSAKDPRNPSEILFKIIKNEGQELRPGEAFLLTHFENEHLQLIGLSNYSESGSTDLQFSLKVVIDQSDLANFSNAFMPDQKWNAKSIGSLITLQRMFESCTTFAGREQTLLEKCIWSGKTSSQYIVNRHIIPLSEEEELLLASLNPSQYEPVKEFLQMQEGLKMIQGPPGTGKTTTVSKLLMALQKRGERILVCASSNKGTQTLAEICLKKCPRVPMILIGVEKKLPEDGQLHPIFLDLWGERQMNALNDLSQDLWKFQMTEIVKGHSKFLMQRVHAACDKLREKLKKLNTFVLEVAPYQLTCFKDLSDRNEWFQESLELYCDFLASQGQDQWNEALLFHEETCKNFSEEVEVPEVVIDSRQFISNFSTLFSFLLMKLEAAAADGSKNGLEAELLNHSQIIFSTLSTSGQQRLKEMKPIDSLIIDEAGQSLEVETTIPLRAKPKKCLLVGDIQQLPATVFSRSAEQLNFGRSMMERLSKNCKVDYSMLTVQYRMHPEICQFPSNAFYDGLLENDLSVHTSPLNLPAFLAPYAFINIQGREEKGSSGHSFKNEAEVKSIQTIVTYLHSQKIDVTKRVGVITFYKAQADRIRDTLKIGFPGIVVNTVDSFQGGECDFIIISCVRANAKKQIGFLDEYRRLNVALTRARISLVVLGNAEALDHSNLALLVADAKKRKVLHSGEVLQQLIPKKNAHRPNPSKSVHCQNQQVTNSRHKTPVVGVQPKNPNYKTELCRHFKGTADSCWQGQKCSYAHGQGELFLK